MIDNYDDIVERLINDYCLHWEKYHKYEKNDDEVNINYHSAICDYLFDLIADVTGKSPEDTANLISDKLEKVFFFDPSESPEDLNKLVPPGTKVCLKQDVEYSFLEEMEETYGLDFIQEYFLIEDGYVTIPKGTHMIYKGCSTDAAGWPVFEIHGEEFDFAGEPFKIKVVED